MKAKTPESCESQRLCAPASGAERFIDAGRYLSEFADEVLVNCSRCAAAGVVRAQWHPHRWTARFHCCNCNLQLDSTKGDWAGPMILHGRQPCSSCGRKWLEPSVEYFSIWGKPPDTISALCHNCGQHSLIAALASRKLPDDHCCDPHFGLPLRLAIRTRHGMMWAYNRRHLDELFAYVAARLRLRGKHSGNRSMFSRLPRWMKQARHRSEIIRALGRLRAMDG